MQVLSFENEFDGVSVSVSTTGDEYDGPYVVAITFNDPAIASAESNKSWSFPTMQEAKLKFLELLTVEIDEFISENCD
jgi:hypothetical protein